ncbi:MAG: hypothetical protein QM811_16700 [Pirellulales bacterium]
MIDLPRQRGQIVCGVGTCIMGPPRRFGDTAPEPAQVAHGPWHRNGPLFFQTAGAEMSMLGRYVVPLIFAALIGCGKQPSFVEAHDEYQRYKTDVLEKELIELSKTVDGDMVKMHNVTGAFGLSQAGAKGMTVTQHFEMIAAAKATIPAADAELERLKVSTNLKNLCVRSELHSKRLNELYAAMMAAAKREGRLSDLPDAPPFPDRFKFMHVLGMITIDYQTARDGILSSSP